MNMLNLLLTLSMPFCLLSCASTTERQIASVERRPRNQIGKRLLFDIMQIPSAGITYYFRPGESADSPLILIIQGSGCDSVYSRDEQGNIFGGLHVDAFDAVGEQAALLAVEKPHINTFYHSKDPGSAISCSEEFKRDFVRDRWLGMLKAAVQDSITSYHLRPRRIVAAGHSEGGEVAAFFAAENSKVSHVLIGAGGGAIQLYEFVVGATTGPNGERMDREQESKAVKDTLNEWTKMSTHRNAVTPLYMGHAPRYGTTFKVSSPAEALKKSKAQVYIMNGTDDSSSPVTSSDLLAAELTVANRKFVYDRIPYADHGFVANGKNGFSEVWAKAFKWAVERE